MIVYIAGKITGNPKYKEQFSKAAKMLKSKGYTVINPCCLPEGLTWEQYMSICIPMVDVADKLYMLENWTDSRGAKLEHDHARKQGKEIMYQSDQSLMSAPSPCNNCEYKNKISCICPVYTDWFASVWYNLQKQVAEIKYKAASV